MIFTILGSLSIFTAVVFFFIFFMCIFQPSLAVNYLVYVIANAINAIVFFTLSKMKGDIKRLEQLLEKQDKLNNSYNNEINNLETKIIKLKQKFEKKDGE